MASGEIDLIPGRQFGATERVDNEKLNDLARPVLRIKEYAVTARELAPGAINADKLSTDISAQLGVTDGSVTTNKIVNGAVTNVKLAEDARVPPGAIMDFAGTTPPSGWLLCGGQSVSRTGFAALFTAIGTTWGAGDGISTFNVPDLRGFVCAGKDDMATGASGRLTSTYIGGGGGPTAVGGYGGGESHALTWVQNGAHYHNVNSVDHGHGVPMCTTAQEGGSNYGLVSGGPWTGRVLVAKGAPGFQGTFGADRSLATTTDSQGSASPHNNVQPTRIVNKIIRT